MLSSCLLGKKDEAQVAMDLIDDNDGLHVWSNYTGNIDVKHGGS